MFLENKKTGRVAFFLILTVFTFIFNAAPAFSYSIHAPPDHKSRRLSENKINSGLDDLIQKLSPFFPDNYAKNVLSDKRLTLDYSVIPRALSPNDTKNINKDFRKKMLSKDALHRSRKYMIKFDKYFDLAHKKYGVKPEIIAAIIRMETNNGSFLGERSVINTLFSSYVLRPNRKNFALNQLKYFLIITRENSWDPYSIIGSNEGAFGIPQFIPSSFKYFAVDGDGDGVIDLLNHADAILSVANYLKKNGWTNNKKNQRKALLRYNNWSIYADLVLEFSILLKTKPMP